MPPVTETPGHDTFIALAEDVRNAFDAAACCYLGTCAGSQPNVVPVGFKWLDGNHILLADLFFGKTRRNLQSNPRVAVTVAQISPKHGYQICGTASLHQSGAVHARVCELLRSHGIDAAPHAAIQVRPQCVYRLDPGEGAGERIA